MADTKISGLVYGAPAQLADLIPIARQVSSQEQNFNLALSDVRALFTSGITGPLSFGQLTSQYSAANIVGTPLFKCTDVGFCGWEPTAGAAGTGAWLISAPFILAQGAIPFGIPSSGTVGANGALTSLVTPFSVTYANGIYLYFPAGALASGSLPGYYWTIMSGTGTGTVYNTMYFAGQPEVPTNPLAFSGTTGTSYTQTTGGYQVLLQANLPANAMGLTGEIAVEWAMRVNNSSNTKPFYWMLGGQLIQGSSPSTNQYTAGLGRIRNAGSWTVQQAIENSQGDVGTGYGIGTWNVNTQLGTSAAMSLSLNAATDWAVVESFSVVCTSSLLADFNATRQPFITASGTTTPPGATAAGAASNLYFISPQLSDVSYANTGTGALFAVAPSIGTYSSSANFSTVNGVLAIALGSGGVFTNVSVAKSSYAGTPAIYNRGTLPFFNPTKSWYCAMEYWLSSNHVDHWPASYLFPAEHNGGLGDQIAGQPTGYEGFLEVDADEANPGSGGIPFVGSLSSVHVWSGIYSNPVTFTGANSGVSSCTVASWTQPSGAYKTTFNNSGSDVRTVNYTQGTNTSCNWSGGNLTGNATGGTSTFSNVTSNNNYTGIALDRTQPHVFGVGYNATMKLVQFWLDDTPVYSFSTASVDAFINPYHMYPIFSVQTHGANVAYAAYLKNISAWTG